MVRMPKPALRTLDTRCARPPEKKAHAELLTPEHRALAATVLRRAGHHASSPIISGKGRTAVIPSMSQRAMPLRLARMAERRCGLLMIAVVQDCPSRYSSGEHSQTQVGPDCIHIPAKVEEAGAANNKKPDQADPLQTSRCLGGLLCGLKATYASARFC